MATTIQVKRASTAVRVAATLVDGEPIFDKTTHLLYVYYSGTQYQIGTAGTVTSVALAMPSIFSTSGSPVTGSGTLTATLATQTANHIFAGPTTGGAAAPTFRAMVSADLPSSPTISGHTTLSGGWTVTSGTCYITSGDLELVSGTLTVGTGGTPGFIAYFDGRVQWNGALQAGSDLSGGVDLPVTGIDATGTPSSTTYLRGDGTWATPSGGGGSSAVNVLVNGDFRRLPRQARATLTGYATADGATSADRFATNWGVQHDAGSTDVQVRNWSHGDGSPPVAFTVLGPSYLQIKNNAGGAAGILVYQFVEANGPAGLAAAALQAQAIIAGVRAVASTGTPTLKVAIREWTGAVDAPTRPVASWAANVPTFATTTYASVGTGSAALNTSTATAVSATGTPSSSCVGLMVCVWVEGLAAGASLYLSSAGLWLGSTAPAWAPHPSDDTLCDYYHWVWPVGGGIVVPAYHWGSTNNIGYGIVYPPMRGVPTIATNLSGFASTTPTGTQMAIYDTSVPAFLTISGTVSLVQTVNAAQGCRLDAVASGSFGGGAAGHLCDFRFGPDVRVSFSAEIVPT